MGSYGMIIYIVAMFGILYFLMIRPAQKRQKEAASMQSNLKRGDEIVTIGGLYGTIDSVADGKMVLNCGNTKLTFEVGAVRQILNAQPIVNEQPATEEK